MGIKAIPFKLLGGIISMLMLKRGAGFEKQPLTLFTYEQCLSYYQ
jgi:hypothetical protein